MGGHYKKKLRAEKSKVKLKGIKLPKGLNVTKTEFKVRKITIREQLKESQYVEGQRQINLKETLTRLKHHSSSFRLDALRTLREAIMNSQPGLLNHLSEIVNGVSSVCLDLEKETRRESFRVLNILLSIFPHDSITPFFHVISSYLRCAMTHIQKSLQEDSLLMLDCLLEHVPNLVAQEHSKIFKNFLEMISRVRAEGDQANRTLTINMGQKQTTIKWRSKVLQRLQHMLQTLCNYQGQNSHGILSRSGKLQTTKFNEKKPQYLSLKRTYISPQYFELSSIFARSANQTGNTLIGDNIGSTDGANIIRSYIDHLMPLLYESWLEVRPSELDSKEAITQSILSNDAATTLKVIMDIMENMWALVRIHETVSNTDDLSIWYQEKYANSFILNFVQSRDFPYQQVESNCNKTSKQKRLPTTGGQFCTEQNICISHLLCLFYTHHIEKKQGPSFLLVLQFLNTILVNVQSNQTDHSYQRYLVAALKTHLLVNGADLLANQTTKEAVTQLCKTTICVFLNGNFPHKEGISSRALTMLCDIVQTPKLYEGYGIEQFTLFLEYLPKLLLNPVISEASLLSMSNLGKQKNQIFLNSLLSLTNDIIQNIQKIKVSGASNAFEGRKLIMNLFYWTDSKWNEKEILDFQQNVTNHVTDKRMVDYFMYVLKV